MRALLLAFCLAAAPAWSQAWDVTRLFALLAKEPPGKATFVERKHLALLDRPVEAFGELAFVPPDRMEKRTLGPRVETVFVDAERITLERGGKRRSLGLRESPAVAVLVEGVRATLAGDLAALTRTYSAALEGTPAAWRLTLRPLDLAASRLVERIDISGSQARVGRVEILQADGDRSVMTITPVTP